MSLTDISTAVRQVLSEASTPIPAWKIAQLAGYEADAVGRILNGMYNRGDVLRLDKPGYRIHYVRKNFEGAMEIPDSGEPLVAAIAVVKGKTAAPVAPGNGGTLVTPNNIGNTRDIRRFLITQMEGVANGTVTIEKAKAICGISQQIHNTLKLELEASRIIKGQTNAKPLDV